MSFDLKNGPINPLCDSYQTMLNHLQGNILSAHKRDHAAHIFLKFKGGAPAIRRWTRNFAASYVTSAKSELVDSTSGLFGNLFLTANGYKALGFPVRTLNRAFPQDREHDSLIVEFTQGMGSHANILNDQPENWELAYQHQQIDAMILLAHDNKSLLMPKVSAIIDHVKQIAEVLTIEYGHVLKNEQGDLIEPFGYTDGKSQPHLLTRDRDSSRTFTPAQWNADASLDLALTPDPLAPEGETDCFGSFLVFRKLEQNVQDFHNHIMELAKTLGHSPAMASALVMGRFKDGTPLALSKSPVMAKDRDFDDNDFNYSDDPDGCKTPLHAHVRRMNPREADSHQRRIIRRSIPYGDLPAQTGVGLLFMCFQSNLAKQFVFLQTIWANGGTQEGNQRPIGIDPIIGQPRPNQKVVGQLFCPQDQEVSKPFHFYGYTTMKGGEFFFAPSLPFLQTL